MVSGIIGSYVVVKRIVFISGSIAHSVLGGIGFAIWLSYVLEIPWLTPLLGAILAAILSALLIGWVHLSFKQRHDTLIASLWAIGMAAGIVFISKTPGYAAELSNYLLGNILWVSTSDLIQLAVLDLIVILLVVCLHKKFLAICFDEKQAALQGINVTPLYLLLLVLTSISIVLLIQIVGIVLVMAMLTIPAALANLFTKRLSHMMLLAIAFSSLFCVFGTAASYHLDWPTGATIALLAGAAYAIVLPIKRGIRA